MILQQNIQQLFEKQGGIFLSSAENLQTSLQNIRAFVFDWDGVFNTGIKNITQGSGYSEPDSMGLNILRLDYWLQHGNLPHIAIITGEHNPAAEKLARREHFSALYSGIKDKAVALQHFCNHFSVSSEQIAFSFDDILDISAARSCGLRFTVKRNASPLFQEYIRSYHFTDYITGNSGGNHAVREISELILGLSRGYENALNERINYTDAYKKYLSLRNSGELRMYQSEAGEIIEVTEK